jgi:hypothetical protein
MLASMLTPAALKRIAELFDPQNNIPLSPEERAWCRWLEGERQKFKRERGIIDQKQGWGDGTDYGDLGWQCELAWEKLTGMPMNRSVEWGDGGDIDFTEDFCGMTKTFSMKGRSSGSYTLIPPKQLPSEGERMKADFVICAEKIGEDTIRFIGWFLGEDWPRLKEQPKIRSLRGRWGVHDTNLELMSELKERIYELRAVGAGA